MPCFYFVYVIYLNYICRKIKRTKNMSFTDHCNEIFNQAIRDYHITDNVDTPINNPYERDSIENRLYLKCWIDRKSVV